MLWERARAAVACKTCRLAPAVITCVAVAARPGRRLTPHITPLGPCTQPVPAACKSAIGDRRDKKLSVMAPYAKSARL